MKKNIFFYSLEFQKPLIEPTKAMLHCFDPLLKYFKEQKNGGVHTLPKTI